MVAALPVVALGLVLLLLLFLLASPSFRQAMLDTVKGIPLIGAWLASNTDALLLNLFARLNLWASWAVLPLETLFQHTADLLNLWTRGTTDAMQAAADATWRLRYVTLPLAAAQGRQYADDSFRLATAYALGLAQLATAYSRQLQATTLAWAEARFAALGAWAEARFAAATAYTVALFGVETEYANRLWVSAVSEARAGEARAEAYSAAEGKALAGWVEELFSTAIGRADQEFRTATGYAGALAGENARYTDLRNAQTVAWTAGIAGVLAGAVTAIENSRCMRQCDTLGSLGEGLSLIDLGAILALVEMAATNPGATADLIQSQLGPLVESSAKTIRGVV